jgi:hypothetical protein
MQGSTPRKVRQAAGVSLAKTAARADVSEPTARVYELDPNAVRDTRKRESLDRVYASLRELASARAL